MLAPVHSNQPGLNSSSNNAKPNHHANTKLNISIKRYGTKSGQLTDNSGAPVAKNKQIIVIASSHAYLNTKIFRPSRVMSNSSASSVPMLLNFIKASSNNMLVLLLKLPAVVRVCVHGTVALYERKF